MGDAYFGFYLLAMGRAGRARRAKSATLATQAGFATAAAVPTRMPLQTGLVVARRGQFDNQHLHEKVLIQLDM